MKIALDYDETFTADPKALTNVVKVFQHCGHTVTFVTFRDGRGPNHDISADAQELGIDIVFTAGKQKQHVFNADIWIDDEPATIVRFEDLGNMYGGCLTNNDLK